ncbi:hypothetical protein ACOZ4L_06075 [Haloplanus ruber]|uniref:PGF-CTERM sorting domain-containing protein n=1 Tax=Haloplanus ruber TaxID=869892 RepID=A0ABD6CU24_9EURY|nr:hypothetical protein [Haloplanus ruber]
MEERIAVAALTLALVSSIGVASLGVPAAAQTGDSPDVRVNVDGSPLDLGEVHRTTSDPWLTVTATAPAGERVTLIEIRVDGETRHAFEPSTREAEEHVVLDLEGGDHRIDVVVRGGGATTYSATVVRDNMAPSVTFAPPLQGGPTGYDTETLERLGTSNPIFVVDGDSISTLDSVSSRSVGNSTLTVGGTIDDHSEIRAVRIEHAYEYAPVRDDNEDENEDREEFAYDPEDQVPIHPGVEIPTGDVDGDGNPDQLDKYFLDSPGDTFNKTLTLALGENYFRIAVEDALGNIAVYHVVVTVNDGTAPTMNVTRVRYRSPTRLHVEGTVSDAVQVHDVWLEDTILTLDDVEADIDAEDLDGTDICAAADLIEFEHDDQLCAVYPGGTVRVTDDDSLVVRHRVVFRRPTRPDADRKRISFNTTVYHPPGDDSLTLGAADTALNERRQTDALSTFLGPNITISDRRTGYAEGRVVSVGGRITGGQPADASVETLDPDTGRLVDIRPVDIGPEGRFATRLDGLDDETHVRVRVRDASGTEYLNSTNVTAPADDPATPAPETPADDGADGTTTPTATPAPPDDGTDGFRIPFLGIVVPIPGVLTASVSIPVPVLGPFDLPLVPVGALALLGGAVAVRRR